MLLINKKLPLHKGQFEITGTGTINFRVGLLFGLLCSVDELQADDEQYCRED